MIERWCTPLLSCRGWGATQN